MNTHNVQQQANDDEYSDYSQCDTVSNDKYSKCCYLTCPTTIMLSTYNAGASMASSFNKAMTPTHTHPKN